MAEVLSSRGCSLVAPPPFLKAHLMVPHKQHYIIPAPSWQSELRHDEIRAATPSSPPCYPSSRVDCCRTKRMLSSSPFSSYSSPSSPSCSESGKYVMRCLSAAHITRTPPQKKPSKHPKNEKKNSSAQVHPQVNTLFQVQRQSKEGFHINMYTDKQIGTNTRLETWRIPKTPRGVCCVITEHTSHFSPDQSLIAITQLGELIQFLMSF